MSLCEPTLRVINHGRTKGPVAAVEAPVGGAGPAADQENHLQPVGRGCELGLPPAPQQDLVAPVLLGGVFHVDLVLFVLAGIVGGQVLQMQMDPLPGIDPDGPVAPERRVGTKVVGREELTRVTMQVLVAAPQGEEGVAVAV